MGASLVAVLLAALGLYCYFKRRLVRAQQELRGDGVYLTLHLRVLKSDKSQWPQQ